MNNLRERWILFRDISLIVLWILWTIPYDKFKEIMGRGSKNDT